MFFLVTGKDRKANDSKGKMIIVLFEDVF